MEGKVYENSNLLGLIVCLPKYLRNVTPPACLCYRHELYLDLRSLDKNNPTFMGKTQVKSRDQNIKDLGGTFELGQEQTICIRLAFFLH